MQCGLFRKNPSKAWLRILFAASHAGKSMSKINAGTFQLHSLTGRQRKIGRAREEQVGFLSPFARGRRAIIALLQTPENLLLKGLSSRALKQIGFKLLPPVFNGVSRRPLAHPENRRLL